MKHFIYIAKVVMFWVIWITCGIIHAQDNRILPDQTVESGDSKLETARTGLTANQYHIENNGSSIMAAGERIRLQPGFVAGFGSNFRAFHQVGLANPIDLPPDDLADDPNSNIVMGSTVGNFNVNESGAATYSIPITVSPGTGGMEPQLALAQCH